MALVQSTRRPSTVEDEPRSKPAPAGTTSPLRDGRRVFAQEDLTDPYTVRSDLYLESGDSTVRLTTGARLVQPDARCAAPEGACVPRTVAVQLTPGSSRLVLVTGDSMTPLTSSALADKDV